ncbi:hypothetical protein [Sedimentisphaera salicampi]|uniref:Uncharacterized protein n=1 Tax=Sedimentisphaera salicampi TaxID=1941349 RepID=A0A1W6LPX3_9BACT|nr:hypothetical protein [Sedimentisphaera salicampi]ARN57848.1 hypothetical protein STSP1_02274 [Sedimentisphaera salicampi]OXU14016.1 hypothetical protein SMSP1_02178 [Sedimentisphaera salicampi]
MTVILKIISFSSLFMLIVPAVMFFAGRIELEQMKTVMFIATVLWFLTASPWMWKED